MYCDNFTLFPDRSYYWGTPISPDYKTYLKGDALLQFDPDFLHYLPFYENLRNLGLSSRDIELTLYSPLGYSRRDLSCLLSFSGEIGINGIKKIYDNVYRRLINPTLDLNRVYLSWHNNTRLLSAFCSSNCLFVPAVKNIVDLASQNLASYLDGELKLTSPGNFSLSNLEVLEDLCRGFSANTMPNRSATNVKQQTNRMLELINVTTPELLVAAYMQLCSEEFREPFLLKNHTLYSATK